MTKYAITLSLFLLCLPVGALTVRNRDFSGQTTATIPQGVTSILFVNCNWNQLEPAFVQGVTRGVSILADSTVAFTFDRRCKLINAEVPAGSTVAAACNQAVVSRRIRAGTHSITVDGQTLERTAYKSVAWGKYDGDADTLVIFSPPKERLLRPILQYELDTTTQVHQGITSVLQYIYANYLDWKEVDDALEEFPAKQALWRSRNPEQGQFEQIVNALASEVN